MDLLFLFAAVIGGGFLVLRSLTNWRFGFLGLLLYLPFAGFVSLRTGQSTLGLLAKDLIFVIPAYISYFLIDRRASAGVKFPAIFTVAMIFLAFLVICQAANPNVANGLV